MFKYVVAWINFFDNELQQQYVVADNEFQALLKSNQDVIDMSDPIVNTMGMEELKQFAFNCDGMISVYRI